MPGWQHILFSYEASCGNYVSGTSPHCNGVNPSRKHSRIGASLLQTFPNNHSVPSHHSTPPKYEGWSGTKYATAYFSNFGVTQVWGSNTDRVAGPTSTLHGSVPASPPAPIQ